MPIIEVNHVTKEYKLGQIQSLKTTALNQWRRLTGQPVEERAPFKALDDVSFSIEPGEVVGIIGHNGAGKSTMLKLLANISKPSSGSIVVKGKVAPLIEVGAGLVGDLTGRENIYLNGAILGIPKAEINRKFDDIVAFAELEEFIDTPIKRYSSGMQVRLGFSIATSVESDILIVDEVLAVGDLAFQRKCFDRMEDLIKRQGKTVLLVSHNIRQVERLCSRVLLLTQGKLALDGSPAEVCNTFYEYSDRKILHAKVDIQQTLSESSGEADLVDFHLLDSDGNSTSVVQYHSDVTVRMRFVLKKTLCNPNFGLGIHTTDFLYLAGADTETQIQKEKEPLILEAGGWEVFAKIRSFPLFPGVYSFRVGLVAGATQTPVYYAENVLNFEVRPSKIEIGRLRYDGFFGLEVGWKLGQTEECGRKEKMDISNKKE